MDNNDNPKESPVFKSTDILNTKAHNQGEYFVNTGKATLSQKLSSWSMKQKQKQNQAKNQPKSPELSSAPHFSKKIVIISVILLVLVAAALTIFFLNPFGWQKKDPDPIINIDSVSAEITDFLTNSENSKTPEEIEQNALNFIDKAKDQNDTLNAQVLLADFYLKNQQEDKFVSTLNAVLDKVPENSMFRSSSLARLADYYKSIGDTESEKATIEKILAMKELDSPYESLEMIQDVYKNRLKEIEGNNEE